MSERIPNVIELGRRPTPLRYVWIAYTTIDDVEVNRIGATWATLKRSREELGDGVVVKIVDIYEDRVHTFATPELIDGFMESWRANYFDDQWELTSS